MKKSTTATRNALETILNWSQDRPAWQRDALRRIVSQGKLDSADIEELVKLCKAGRGAPGDELAPSPLESSHLPADPEQGSAVALVSVEKVEGVNNLAPDQTMTFETDGITIIYGDNGTGKSGYARILKRTCRARHMGKIEPNVYEQGSKREQASATLSYAVGGAGQQPEKWEDGDHPHPVLSAVSVFDSECASVYLNKQNNVAFRPFGLDIPDELARACQFVKEALASEQEQLAKNRSPAFQNPRWKATTAVGKALADLKHDTDVLPIRDLGELSDEDRERLTHLREDLSRKLPKAATEQVLKANNIRHLLDAMKLIEAKTADPALRETFNTYREAQVKREAARLASERAFSEEPLAGVGSATWRSLWEAARRYSTKEPYPGEPFPATAEDARCVLCQQALQADAVDRMARFERFIQKDTEQQAQMAEQAAQSAIEQLATVNISTYALKANLEEVAIQDAELGRKTRRFIAAARLRRYALTRRLGDEKEPLLPAVPEHPVSELDGLESRIREYAAELQKAAADEERKHLETELAELIDRELLGEMIHTVEEEVLRLENVHFLENCLADTNTTAVTRLGNDIADAVVTPRLRDRFQKEIVELVDNKVRVEIVRSGGKSGSPHYQVRLFAKPNAKVKDILSEGERTCVALAAFLTEVATATHRSAFVFDDPVSSLDHRWRKQVAKRLVHEAGRRQVVVFTHDLVFVNDLRDLADKKQAIKTLTVSRGPSGAGVVTENLPWKAQSVNDRIDKLEKATKEAGTLYEKNDEDAYRNEAARIYADLRASWERAIEEVAFSHVVQRHRDYIATKNLKKVTVLSEADCDAFHAGFRKCCGIVDAHDPSSGRNAEAPPPNEISEDIQALKCWVTDIKSRQRKVTSRAQENASG